MFKGALIGCGFFAQNHLHAWRDVNGAEITTLCDRDEKRLAETAHRFSITKTYTDAQEMLDAEELDFVDIATTVETHLPLVKMSATKGLHIVCQKPFAGSMDDAYKMVLMVEEAGVTLMVHENFRWQSAIRAVQGYIAKGAIGDVFWGRVSFRSAYDVYAGQPYLATDEKFIIQDLGIHILDIARFLFGDVKSISASTKRVNPNIRAEDVATMMLNHQNGITSIVDCSYATRLPTENFPETLLEIDGSKGTLRLTSGYQLQLHNDEGTQNFDVAPPLLPWAERPWHNIQESVFNIEQHFADCLHAQKVPETSGADNLRTLGLVYAAYQSVQAGKGIIFDLDVD